MPISEQTLIDSIVTKCKISLVCIFQGEDEEPSSFSEYELAYILERIQENRGKL